MSPDISPNISCNWHSSNQFRCTFSPTSSSLSVLRLLGFPPVENKESSLRTILRGAVQIRLSKNPKKAIGIGYIQTMHESNHSHQYHQYHDWHQFHVILKMKFMDLEVTILTFRPNIQLIRKKFRCPETWYWFRVDCMLSLGNAMIL